MAWMWLLLAGICEVGWAIGMKASANDTRLWVPTVVVMVMSFALLWLALKSLPLGTAYAVWTGIGVVGTALWGIMVLGEPRDLLRLLSLGAVIFGIVGLRLVER